MLVATVMPFELCYVKEWVEYHLDYGSPRTTIYLLPQHGPPHNNGLHHDSGLAEFMRKLNVATSGGNPRVQVLCNVSGVPGSCTSHAAAPYTGRRSHQVLAISHLIPRP